MATNFICSKFAFTWLIRYVSQRGWLICCFMYTWCCERGRVTKPKEGDFGKNYLPTYIRKPHVTKKSLYGEVLYK